MSIESKGTFFQEQKELLEERIFDSVAKLLKEGKIELDFSHYVCAFYGFSLKGKYKGLTFYSWDFQEVEGPSFGIENRSREFVLNFNRKRSGELRNLVWSLAQKDPTVLKIWRDYHGVKVVPIEENEAARKERQERRLGELSEVVSILEGRP